MFLTKEKIDLTFNFPKGNSLGKFEFFNVKLFSYDALSLFSQSKGTFFKFTDFSVTLRRTLESINFRGRN